MKLTGLTALVLTVASATGCHLVSAARQVATDYVLVVDRTRSVSASERAAWAVTADEVLRRLALGDSVLILPVHDRTLDAAPLFHGRVPGQGVSLEEITRGKRRLKEIREAARQVIREALEPERQAKGTDLLAVVDRVAAARIPGADRVTRVYIFSDGLQSMPPINLEKTALSAGEIPQLVSRIGQQSRWHGGLLAGVKVLYVLNGIDSGRRDGVNDRRIVGEFWRVLFTSVGADLVSFDTFLQE